MPLLNVDAFLEGMGDSMFLLRATRIPNGLILSPTIYTSSATLFFSLYLMKIKYVNTY